MCAAVLGNLLKCVNSVFTRRNGNKVRSEYLVAGTQQWPQDWKRSVFIPIPKKGNAKVNRERELKEEIRKGRDKEIELVIHRLEADMTQAREESERAAENR